MTENEIYISVNDLAQLKGVTSRAIRLSIGRGRYVAREIEVHGGKSYEVLLSSVEKHIQQRYFEQETSSAIENHLPDINEKDFVPSSAKETAIARIDLLKEWRKFRNSHHKKTSADKEFLESYNSGMLYEKIFLKIGSVSIGTLKRWNKILGCSSEILKILNIITGNPKNCPFFTMP